MKKWFLVTVLCLFMVPYYVDALTISDVVITGDNTVYTTKSIPLKVAINFNNFDNLGIAVVSYQISFNEYAFGITKIDTNDVWDSKLYKDESSNKYYVVSQITSGASNRCSDGLLYCGNYEATITFYAKDTDTIRDDEIKLSEIELGLLNVEYQSGNITSDDVVLFQDNKTASKIINIEKSGVIKAMNIPPLEVSKTKPKISSETTKIEKNKTTKKYTKSKNNYIEKLEIDGYKLKFKMLTNDYHLTVKEGVNSLKMAVSLISSKAKYKIIGADDLAKNNNEVKIEVTAENGDKNTYTIKVDHEKPVVMPLKNPKKEEKHFDTKYLIIAGSILGGIIFILFVIKIFFQIRDHKMEKKLDKL